MRFERLTNEKHEMYKKALELYSISFPSHEQRDMVSQTKILNDDDYYFNLIYDEEAFVGLALCWETKSLCMWSISVSYLKCEIKNTDKRCCSFFAGTGGWLFLKLILPLM